MTNKIIRGAITWPLPLRQDSIESNSFSSLSLSSSSTGTTTVAVEELELEVPLGFSSLTTTGWTADVVLEDLGVLT
jgi:hypothetical protein